jgi:hypothetical protein
MWEVVAALQDERFTHASAAAQQLVQAMMADKAAHRPTAEQVGGSTQHHDPAVLLWCLLPCICIAAGTQPV